MSVFNKLPPEDGEESSVVPFATSSDSRIGKAISYYNLISQAAKHGKKGYDWIQNRRKLSVTITSKDTLYFPLLEWLASDHFSQKAKDVAIVARSSYDDDLGYSSPNRLKVVQNTREAQKFTLEGHKIQVVLDDGTTKANNSGIRSQQLVQSLVFTTYSNEAHEALLTILFDMYEKYSKEYRPPKLFAPAAWGGFNATEAMPPRSLDSVILKEGELDFLIADLDQFISSEDRYNRLGIPWHRGYLFYGDVGTGKTSIAKALSTHFGLDVYYLPLGDLKDDASLSQLIDGLKPKSVLLLEDVDVFSAATSRKAEANEASLSGLLNTLDGVATPHGMITIMTTNEIDKLDSALIRPGRIDVQHQFTSLDDDQGQRLFAHFYGYETKASFAGLAPADVVGIFKQHLDDGSKALKLVQKKRRKCVSV